MRDHWDPWAARGIANVMRCALVASTITIISAVGACKSESKSAPAPQAEPPSEAPSEPTERPQRTRRDLRGPSTPFGDRPLLDRFDNNGDGQLDDAERAAMSEARLEAVFAQLDTNGDGSISPTEGQAAGRRVERLLKRWDEIDIDKSGGLSRDELGAALDRKRRRDPSPTAPSQAIID